ncbi:hypothetical protein [Kineococcus rhizosphaerae]|uniref:Uncharacterized protein n=1 Tax=Kineococcus rhizosphaerae TaxID=559628 RepID=A0A2T0R9W5_9ACTN|nr:hypothetical protein [Kineococcus rhizosphaerae]PRY17955.1 hypothetical protein CLV37_101197 [Kineococcus rhizosphaerae]
MSETTAFTLRLDAAHRSMLERLQSRHPGVSRQRLFEGLLEQADDADRADVQDVARAIYAENKDLFDALTAGLDGVAVRAG